MWCSRRTFWWVICLGSARGLAGTGATAISGDLGALGSPWTLGSWCTKPSGCLLDQLASGLISPCLASLWLWCPLTLLRGRESPSGLIIGSHPFPPPRLSLALYFWTFLYATACPAAARFSDGQPWTVLVLSSYSVEKCPCWAVLVFPSLS